MVVIQRGAARLVRYHDHEDGDYDDDDDNGE